MYLIMVRRNRPARFFRRTDCADPHAPASTDWVSWELGFGDAGHAVVRDRVDQCFSLAEFGPNRGMT